jgi:hypothetical protein
MHATYLNQLNLKYNNITSIQYNFDELGSTKYLDLSNNRIVSVLAHTFNSLVALDDLRQDFNRIERIQAGVFESLKNLTYLGLHENKLT